MNRYCCTLFFAGLSIVACSQTKLLSPDDFLGYELGDRFTRHADAVAYYRHVAGALDNVEVFQYGETYEHRPLIYAVVTSADNFKNLEQIRLDNVRRTGMVEGTPSGNKKAIVWLSYNVHGNEASGTEAALLTLYELSNPANTRTQEWLKNTVVILDPCINPDGRERYASFYSQYGNIPPDPDPVAFEHREPWPGGRSNHYLFDLNRDWAWGTQIESQHRIKIYNQWMPHVHVDFHEQSYASPYYFAPAAEPFHEVITPWQREFQTRIGKNNARYFDEQGWLYFTREIFDLYYPSYGDTYPTYNGAIGMTYEQAGGGRGGLQITTPEGDPLTLKDRLIHHHTTGLSTVEITAQNAARVVDEFQKYFDENNTKPAALYKTFVIKSDNNPDKIATLLQWMDRHGIKYGHPAAAKTLNGFDYQLQKTSGVAITSSDIVVNTDQPKSRFISAVFEPQSKLPDSLTYDITAWNLMYAHDLRAYALTDRVAVAMPYKAKAAVPPAVKKPYAYIFRYQHLRDVEFMATLMRRGIKVRSAQNPFSSGGQNYDAGTIIIPRRNNEGVHDFDKVINDLAQQYSRQLNVTTTGFVDQGRDIGSADVNYLKAPKIGMLVGEQTSTLSVGQIWYFFEQEIHYPVTQIGTSYFKNADWRKYDVLIIPEGNYHMFDEDLSGEILDWVSDGGRLIITGEGLKAFADKKGFALRTYASEEERERLDKQAQNPTEKETLMRYADAERKKLSDEIFGAIYQTTLDNSHPLAFGLKERYFTLKTSALRFAYLSNGWNVGIIKGRAKPVQGFAGHRINRKLDNSLIFGVEEKGQGNIVYLVDNPLFRNFWENGKLIFSNAVFMVGQ
ncbi:MAG TPA: M14 family metallopeptidase [Ohtaekwangia sp.]|nr:M14 family metallopeptidase [Ohtaekwangia sp.]